MSEDSIITVRTRTSIVFIVWHRLPCSFVAQALLSSYAVQSQIGDHEEVVHGAGTEYLKEIPFAPSQGDELLEKIAELHRLHKCVYVSRHLLLHGSAGGRVGCRVISNNLKLWGYRQTFGGGVNMRKEPIYIIWDCKNIRWVRWVGKQHILSYFLISIFIISYSFFLYSIHPTCLLDSLLFQRRFKCRNRVEISRQCKEPIHVRSPSPSSKGMFLYNRLSNIW